MYEYKKDTNKMKKPIKYTSNGVVLLLHSTSKQKKNLPEKNFCNKIYIQNGHVILKLKQPTTAYKSYKIDCLFFNKLNLMLVHSTELFPKR